MFPRVLSIGLLPLLLAGAVAAGAGGQAARQPVGASPKELADSLRDYLAHRLPTTLYEARLGWGHTAQTPTGLKWTGKGLHSHVRIAKGERNSGAWREIHVTAPNLPETLFLDIRNVRPLEDSRTFFDVFVAFNAQVEYRQQNWKAGVKLFDGSARARLQVQMALACELSTRLEWSGKLLPDVVVRLRVTQAHVGYDHLVVEHIAGIGGDAAKLLGDAIQEGIHQWQPSIERKLLARANAAIEKAADTKEVRLGLGSLQGSKGRGPKGGRPNLGTLVPLQ